MFTVMDQDRYCGAVEIGHCNITMKEAKQISSEPERFTATQLIEPANKPSADLLLGLSYLPTAQRLAFTLIKVTNIADDKMKGEQPINPYIRIMMFSKSGRLVNKKKTSAMANTLEPIFNETINIEVAPEQLQHTKFLISLWSRRKVAKGTVEVDSSDQESTDNGFFSLESLTDLCGPAGKLRDVCLGRFTLGRTVQGETERDHYNSVCEYPRQGFSMWHSLM